MRRLEAGLEMMVRRRQVQGGVGGGHKGKLTLSKS